MTDGKTCASCRFFGRDEPLSGGGFMGIMYPCKKSAERIADNPRLKHMALTHGKPILYEYSNLDKCDYFEEDNGNEGR